MRLLVLSDVHADAAALQRVLDHARGQRWDQALFLGDAVGYGSQAHEAVARIRELPVRAAILGNHEVMLNQLRSGRRPNAAAPIVAALAANLRELDDRDLEFLDNLRPEHLDGGWGATHGALRAPFEYLVSVPVARANAGHMKRDIHFVGHTHVPAAYLQEPGGDWSVRAMAGRVGTVRVAAGARAFLNPGAVSLPRDRIPGNCYGVYDEEAREFTVFRLS